MNLNFNEKHHMNCKTSTKESHSNENDIIEFSNILKSSGSDTLIIIGNGFDLFHGIKSSYHDFRDFVKKNHRSLVGMMDEFFCGKTEFWKDIEESLGEYDVRKIFEYCKGDEEIDFKHFTRSASAIEDAPIYLFNPHMEEFYQQFKKWVNKICISTPININDTSISINLPKDSKYFTFNYTETLEKLYRIPQKNILHIHGSRCYKKSGYIFGHNHYREPIVNNDKITLMPYEKEAVKGIIETMNGYLKNPQDVIGCKLRFFDGLIGIKRVIVFGHSFSKIDSPYFEKILKQIGNQAQWFISYHSQQDCQRIKQFADSHNIQPTFYYV